MVVWPEQAVGHQRYASWLAAVAYPALVAWVSWPAIRQPGKFTNQAPPVLWLKANAVKSGRGASRQLHTSAPPYVAHQTEKLSLNLHALSRGANILSTKTPLPCSMAMMASGAFSNIYFRGVETFLAIETRAICELRLVLHVFRY